MGFSTPKNSSGKVYVLEIDPKLQFKEIFLKA